MAKRAVVVSVLVVLLGFCATLPLPRIDRHIVGGDGMYYFSILRSAVFDRDLDLRNDYALLGTRPYADTPLGRPGAPFSVGAPLLWLPFFAFAHGLSLLLHAFGGGWPIDGVGPVYESLVCIGTILYSGFGLWLTFRVAREILGDDVAAAMGAPGIWWASGLIEYTVAEPSLSHGASFFASALFLRVWYRPGAAAGLGRMAVLGACAALTTLVRAQEALILVVPLLTELALVARGQRRIGRAVLGLAVLLGVFVVGILPQAWFYHSIYGAWLTVPQGKDFMRWSSPVVGGVLFSTRHGLISWHPVILFALVGLLPLWGRDRLTASTIAAVFLVQWYVNSSNAQWWAGDSFGARRFSASLPWLAISLGALAAECRARPTGRWAPALALSLLVAWNGLSFVQYRLGLIPRDEALSWRQMTTDRLMLPITLARRFRHW